MASYNAPTVLREVCSLPENLRKDSTKATVGDRMVLVREEKVIIGVDPVSKIARLTCTCAKYQRSFPTPACAHILLALIHEWDGKANDGSKVALPSFLEVPVFFPNPALLVPVRLAPGPFEDSFSVSLADDQIGFIFLGQGRKSIRAHILDWLVEKASMKLPYCAAPQHYSSLPWQLEHFDIRDKTHLTNLADLLLTGQCRPCNEDSGVPDVRYDA